MPRPAPSFPAFDEWQRLSEREQDALLDQLEAVGRRSPTMRQVRISALSIAACTAIGLALLVMMG